MFLFSATHPRKLTFNFSFVFLIFSHVTALSSFVLFTTLHVFYNLMYNVNASAKGLPVFTACVMMKCLRPLPDTRMYNHHLWHFIGAATSQN